MTKWEWIAKNLNLPYKVSNILFNVYAVFITALFGLYSLVKENKPSGVLQKTSYQIVTSYWLEIIIIIGLTLMIIFIIFALLIREAKLKLQSSGDSSPCIRALLQAAAEFLRPELERNYDITIFKAIDNKKLIYFAGSTGKKEKEYIISNTLEDPSWSEIQKCWFENSKTITNDRKMRSSVKSYRSKTYSQMNTVIAMPVIPYSRMQKTPWGIVRIRSKKTITLPVMESIVFAIHDENDGIISTLEMLLENQHFCKHFVQFY